MFTTFKNSKRLQYSMEITVLGKTCWSLPGGNRTATKGTLLSQFVYYLDLMICAAKDVLYRHEFLTIYFKYFKM